MNKITIMVSIYNSGEWLENKLDNLSSIVNNNECEIYCVNANSPDPRDDEIPKKFKCTYIKLNERLSLYDTWNYIINNSNSLYITNSNTDDLNSPDCFKKLSEALDSNPEYDVVYPSWHCTGIPNLKWSDNNYSAKLWDNDGRPGHFAGDFNTAGVGHFPMWRRSLHDKIGLFNPKYTALADAMLWCRAYYLGKSKFLWYNEYLGCYLWRNGENLWNREISPDQWSMFHKEVNAMKNSIQ